MRTHLKGFTLIELLVVIAIIAILAAILFPVFAQVREKARQITCTSNCKQFGLAILQYAEDYDEAMPIAYNTGFQVGPLTSKLTGAPQQGVYMEIMPYIKSQQAFLCPDDGGFEPAGAGPNNDTPPNVCTGACLTAIANQSYEQVYGSSYKFTHENFSNPFTDKLETGYSQDSVADNGPNNGECTSGTINPAASAGVAANSTLLPGAVCTSTEPAVITLGFFARPTETRMFRDFNPPFDQDDDRIWHKNGANLAYVDGHAKFITGTASPLGPGNPGSSNGYYQGCDGPTWAWDTFGSCNTLGYQRNGD